MNLKQIINEYRKNKDKKTYAELAEKIFDMHNKNEALGIFMKLDEKGNFVSFLTKDIANDVYIPIFTEDADSINNVLEDQKEYVLVMMKISGLFQLLLNQSNVEGFVLNDGDGPGNVLFPKELLEKTIELQ